MAKQVEARVQLIPMQGGRRVRSIKTGQSHDVVIRRASRCSGAQACRHRVLQTILHNWAMGH